MLVLSTEPTTAILKIYGDTVIAVRFDPETRRYPEGDFIIFKLGQAPLELQKENVGPLRPGDD